MENLRNLLLILFVFVFAPVQAQEITGRILDQETEAPIPYATIIYGDAHGVISNDEGSFSIYSEEAFDSLSVASLGYETLKIATSDLKGDIYLKPQTVELQEVFLSDKNLSAEEIFEKAKSQVVANYDFSLSQKRFFFRKSYHQNIKELDLEVEESTIDGIDQNFLDQIIANLPKETGSYEEVLGDLYGNYESQKINIVKAANLYNDSATEKLDELTDEFERIFRETIKEDSFLKIRTGLIGTKIGNEELQEGLKETAKEQTPEEKAEAQAKRKSYILKRTGSDIKSLLGNMFWKEDIELNLFEKSRKYEFKLEGYAQMDGHSVYVLKFAPKRKADFRGKLFVNTLDYGVHRIDYENVKPLFSFGLFGIRTTDDVYRGKMIFSRDKDGKYAPKYVEQQQGTTIAIDRPLKIIEKNRVVPGRNKQNELDLEVKFGVSEVETHQFFVYDSHPIAKNTFDSLESTEDFDYQNFQKYNAEYWEGTNIVEPNTAIREFTAMTP